MNGFDVLETIWRDPGLQTRPVILLTGCDNPNDIVHGSELHADEYLSKPVSTNILLNRIKRLLFTHTGATRRWIRARPGTAGSGGKPPRRWLLTSGSPESMEQS
jgi:DNA-binding response OmpR family regulator